MVVDQKKFQSEINTLVGHRVPQLSLIVSSVSFFFNTIGLTFLKNILVGSSLCYLVLSALSILQLMIRKDDLLRQPS